MRYDAAAPQLASMVRWDCCPKLINLQRLADLGHSVTRALQYLAVHLFVVIAQTWEFWAEVMVPTSTVPCSTTRTALSTYKKKHGFHDNEEIAILSFFYQNWLHCGRVERFEAGRAVQGLSQHLSTVAHSRHPIAVQQ